MIEQRDSSQDIFDPHTISHWSIDGAPKIEGISDIPAPISLAARREDKNMSAYIEYLCYTDPEAIHKMSLEELRGQANKWAEKVVYLPTFREAAG